MSKTREVRLPVTLVTSAGEVPPGVSVKLPRAEADDLIKRYGEAPVHTPASAPAPKRPEGKALTAAIVAEIAALDTDNDDHFTRGGLPSVAVLTQRLGYEVTSAERDAAWAEIQGNTLI